MRSTLVRCGATMTLVLTAACASEPTPASPAISVAETTPTTTPTTTPPTTATSTTPPTSAAATTSAPATTAVVAPATVPGDAIVPEGFDRVAATVTMADGSVCDLCLWLAASGEQRQRGLMFVTDLGAADGMAFRYESPHSGSFWMQNTLLPLSIGFYDAEGVFLDAFDMQPCTADPCPTYRTPDGFLVAIETDQGGLADLGMEPGSTLQLSDLPCA